MSENNQKSKHTTKKVIMTPGWYLAKILLYDFLYDSTQGRVFLTLHFSIDAGIYRKQVIHLALNPWTDPVDKAMLKNVADSVLGSSELFLASDFVEKRVLIKLGVGVDKDKVANTVIRFKKFCGE